MPCGTTTSKEVKNDKLIFVSFGYLKYLVDKCHGLLSTIKRDTTFCSYIIKFFFKIKEIWIWNVFCIFSIQWRALEIKAIGFICRSSCQEITIPPSIITHIWNFIEITEKIISFLQITHVESTRAITRFYGASNINALQMGEVSWYINDFIFTRLKHTNYFSAKLNLFRIGNQFFYLISVITGIRIINDTFVYLITITTSVHQQEFCCLMNRLVAFQYSVFMTYLDGESRDIIRGSHNLIKKKP